MSYGHKEELLAKAHSTILLCLANEMFREVIEEKIMTGLWLKLKNRYMTKSLTNRLYLNYQLYHLHMKEGTHIKDYINKFNKAF